jgi:simple sugar transport system permease protein
LHWGFVLSLAAVVFVWWLLNRSSVGFAFRAVGENPRAARVAGIDVPRTTVSVMLVSGALVGLAGVQQVLGTVTTGFGADIDAGIGFDAITVALLGRSNPWGVLAAGILFGAFKAGGSAMQAAEGIPIEIVLVVQSLIVLFIAAPPLVRAIFRLPQPGTRRRSTPPVRTTATTTEGQA